MLEEIKIIPSAYSPDSSPLADTRSRATLPRPGWEQREPSVSASASGYEQDMALVELWPARTPSPETPAQGSATRWSFSPTPCEARTPPPAVASHSPSPLPPVPEQAAPPSRRPARAPAPAPAYSPDPSFDRRLWRRGTIVQLYDRHADQWLEATITRVQRNAFGAKGKRRDPNTDGLHLLYKPAKKLKGSWVWKDHKPTKRKETRRRRVSAIKEDTVGDVDWETTILLARDSRRLRAAVRVVWDEASQSYFHEEPEECSSSESEPEEYSSGEEAEDFWNRFQSWKGVGKAPPSWSAETPQSATLSYSKHTQRTQQSQGTFGSRAASSKLSSNPTPKSVGTRSHWTSTEPTVPRAEDNDSSEEEPIM